MQGATNKNELALQGLLRAVRKLSWEEFQEFISKALALQPRPPEPPRLSRRETALLLKVNAGPRPEWHQEYRKLIEKRRSEGLTSGEQKHLLKLTSKMERYDVQRMKWLAELASIRGVPLRVLIKSLGLKTPEYV